MCSLRQRRFIALVRFSRRYIIQKKKLRTHIARAHIFRRIIVKHLYGKLVFVEKSLSLWLDIIIEICFGPHPLILSQGFYSYLFLLHLLFLSLLDMLSAYPLNFVHFFRKVCGWFHVFWNYHATFLLPSISKLRRRFIYTSSLSILYSAHSSWAFFLLKLYWRESSQGHNDLGFARKKETESVSRSVVSDFLWPCGL